MAIDDALVEVVTEVADEVIDIDLGASQAQGGFTAHGDAMFALSTMKTSVFNISDLIRITTVQHLSNEVIIVFSIISGI